MNKNNKHITSLLYCFSLIALLILSIEHFQHILQTSLLVLLCIIIIVFHFLCFISISFILQKRKDHAFRKQYLFLYHEYKQTGDAKQFYDGLRTISNQPISKNNKTAYYFHLSITAYQIGKGKEALCYLDHIPKNINSELEEALQQHRIAIYKKYQIK